MLKREERYDFRKRMCAMHKRILRDKSVQPKSDEFSLDKEISIYLAEESVVASLAAKDFCAYLKTAFGIHAKMASASEGADIVAKIERGNLGLGEGYMGFKLVASGEGIEILGYDERGIAQGFYAIEEELNAKGQPYLNFGAREKRPAFSPRMIHSGYGLDQYPDEYLSACAHHGYDAILVFVKDKDHSAHGPCDFNDIVKRAAKYGIDVYAYSYLKNFVHPEAEGAKEIYDSVYGTIFREIKGLRGMVFVGESIEFPSKDPNVAPISHLMSSPDGIPDEKIYPGWWPCYDYAEWVSLVRDTIRAVSPEADVVFWSYNWGWVDAENRLKLIDRLPTDISLLVTFEMFEQYELGNSTQRVCDYTVTRVGPGKYFTSEAEAAARRGIKLYSMTNTAGRTWDYGVAPYEPFPYQWNRRFEKINEYRESCGLSGLMESHHFGFTPSFITELGKNSYTIGGMPFEEKMAQIAKRLSQEEPEKVCEALNLWSEGINHHSASDENQYGPFRIGPAYPFCLKNNLKCPDQPGAHFGNRIYEVGLNCFDLSRRSRETAYSIRIKDELRENRIAQDFYKKGVKILKSIKRKNNELLRLINLGEFLVRCHETANNAKLMYIEARKLFSATNRETIRKCILNIEKIGKREIKNAEATIPIVEKDSAIGFEPSMLYQCSKENILWKIKQTNYMLTSELDFYRTSLKY
jgi:hypothetical protein